MEQPIPSISRLRRPVTVPSASWHSQLAAAAVQVVARAPITRVVHSTSTSAWAPKVAPVAMLEPSPLTPWPTSSPWVTTRPDSSPNPSAAVGVPVEAPPHARVHPLHRATQAHHRVRAQAVVIAPPILEIRASALGPASASQAMEEAVAMPVQCLSAMEATLRPAGLQPMAYSSNR